VNRNRECNALQALLRQGGMRQGNQSKDEKTKLKPDSGSPVDRSFGFSPAKTPSSQR
jgi:hypothetical protein